MDATSLYDLLKPLSDAGREIAAQQQGLAEHGNGAAPSSLIGRQDIAVIKSFAEQAAAHTATWQGMPQAGISLTDVARSEKPSLRPSYILGIDAQELRRCPKFAGV